MDEGVPRSAGSVLAAAGNEVFYLQEAAAAGSSDPVVCKIAESCSSILVALDNDMRGLASRWGAGRIRYKTLSLVHLKCRESRAAERLKSALSLIEHEWQLGGSGKDRRLFVTIGDTFIRTDR